MLKEANFQSTETTDKVKGLIEVNKEVEKWLMLRKGNGKYSKIKIENIHYHINDEFGCWEVTIYYYGD